MQQAAIKSIEFRIDTVIPIEWSDLLRRIWNDGLFYLNWYEHQSRVKACQDAGIVIDPRIKIEIKKVDGEWIFYQPTEAKRRIDRSKSWDRDNIEIVPIDFTIEPEEILAAGDRRLKPRYVNPKWLDECPLATDSLIELRKPFAQMRCDWLKESSLPSTIVSDFIELALFAAWDAYKHGIRKKPHYKKPTDRINTIPSQSYPALIRHRGGETLDIRGLGRVEVPGLRQRLLDPVEKLNQRLKNSPESFDSFVKKQVKMVAIERNKLIKANSLDPKVLAKQDDWGEIKDEYESKVDLAPINEKILKYFSEPSGFRLLSRNGNTYLQITAHFLVDTAPTNKEIEIEIGSNALIESNRLKIPHLNFSKAERRLSGLDKRISLCVHGSNMWQKLMKKKRKLESEIKSSRKLYQAFYAQQLTDVNQKIVANELDIKAAVGLPIPKPDGEGEYLPNGATIAHQNNRQIYDCALGQFKVLLRNQATARRRELIFKTPDRANSEDNSPSNRASDETVSRNGNIGGKDSKPTPNDRTTTLVPRKNKRSKQRERAIDRASQPLPDSGFP